MTASAQCFSCEVVHIEHHGVHTDIDLSSLPRLARSILMERGLSQKIFKTLDAPCCTGPGMFHHDAPPFSQARLEDVNEPPEHWIPSLSLFHDIVLQFLTLAGIDVLPKRPRSTLGSRNQDEGIHVVDVVANHLTIGRLQQIMTWVIANINGSSNRKAPRCSHCGQDDCSSK